jgi:hypothetical protein
MKAAKNALMVTLLLLVVLVAAGVLVGFDEIANLLGKLD